MKVLERKERPTAIVNCPHCGSKLEIDSSDIFWHSGSSGVAYVVCAVCHKGFDVGSYKEVNRILRYDETLESTY